LIGIIKERKEMSNPSSPGRKKKNRKDEEFKSPKKEFELTEDDKKNFQVISEPSENLDKNSDMPRQYKFAHISGKFID
jgi:hypothetical protein